MTFEVKLLQWCPVKMIILHSNERDHLVYLYCPKIDHSLLDETLWFEWSSQVLISYSAILIYHHPFLVCSKKNWNTTAFRCSQFSITIFSAFLLDIFFIQRCFAIQNDFYNAYLFLLTAILCLQISLMSPLPQVTAVKELNKYSYFQ